MWHLLTDAFVAFIPSHLCWAVPKHIYSPQQPPRSRFTPFFWKLRDLTDCTHPLATHKSVQTMNMLMPWGQWGIKVDGQILCFSVIPGKLLMCLLHRSSEVPH